MNWKYSCLGILFIGLTATAQQDFSKADLTSLSSTANQKLGPGLSSFNALRSYPGFSLKSSGSEFTSEIHRLKNLSEKLVSARPQQGQLGSYGADQPVLQESLTTSVPRGLMKDDLSRLARFVEEMPTELKNQYGDQMRKLIQDLEHNAITDSDEKTRRESKIKALTRSLNEIEAKLKTNSGFASATSIGEIKGPNGTLTLARIQDEFYVSDGKGQWNKNIPLQSLEKIPAFKSVLNGLKDSAKNAGKGLGASIAISVLINQVTVGAANATELSTGKVGSAPVPQPYLAPRETPAAPQAAK